MTKSLQDKWKSETKLFDCEYTFGLALNYLDSGFGVSVEIERIV